MDNTQTIILLFKEKPEEAFSLLYDNYYQPLVHFAISIVEDAGVAEDIVQDFFVNFWLRKQYRKIDGGLEKYLYRSIKNNALISIRNSSRRANIIEKLYRNDSPFSHPEAEADAFETLHWWINRLPGERKKIFQLVYLEEKSYQEAADLLCISKNTVKTQIARSLQFLREHLPAPSIILQLILFRIKAARTGHASS